LASIGYRISKHFKATTMKSYFMLMFFLLLFTLHAQPSEPQDITFGKQLFEEGKLEEAKVYFTNLLDEDDEIAEAQYYLAFTFFRLGELDDAIDHCEEAVDLDPGNAEFHFRLGQLYGEDAKDASLFRLPFLAGDIKEQFELAIEIDPNHIGGNIGLAEFYFQAPGIAGGDIDKAIEQAKVVTKLEEKEGRFLLARIYTSEERFDEVEKEYNILEEKFGEEKDFFYFYNTYGYFLLSRNRIDEAIVKFQKQIEFAPDRSNPYDSLGDAFRRKGLLTESLSEYNKALELAPNNERIEKIISEISSEINSK